MRQWRRVSTTDSESGTSSKGLTAGAPHLKVTMIGAARNQQEDYYSTNNDNYVDDDQHDNYDDDGASSAFSLQ
eukprot:4917-Heterococcus_DN1.PRE.1